MKLLTTRSLFLVKCLDLPEAAQVDDAKWERFQIAHLNDNSTFRIEDKSRQIAWSFTVAAEAVANALIDGESTVFVSINKDEASEKVIYARRVYENLYCPPGYPKVIKDNVMGLEFDNGARILSLPSTEPRGKAQFNIVLDEFAHVQHDRQIFGAAMPIISRGGKMRIGSSPMGAGGMFWEISQQSIPNRNGELPFPDFVRVSTPWWEVNAFCGTKATGAEVMPTAERVEKFGNERIQYLFRNNLLEDFQQEHECLYVDETISFFTWELIRKNQTDLLCYRVKDPDDIEDVVRQIKADIAAGKIEDELMGGMDIGRKKDLTEIFFVGAGDTNPLRLMISLDRVEFAKQEKTVRHVLDILPVTNLLVDETGMGMQMAENLSADTVAEGVWFTNALKQKWATTMRKQMELGAVPIPNDRDLAYQIHSVKKKVTAAKHLVFDTEKNEKHHADKFWALALAVTAAEDSRGAGMEAITLRW